MFTPATAPDHDCTHIVYADAAPVDSPLCRYAMVLGTAVMFSSMALVNMMLLLLKVATVVSVTSSCTDTVELAGLAEVPELAVVPLLTSQCTGSENFSSSWKTGLPAVGATAVVRFTS